MSDPVHSGKVTASSVGALRECASRLATSTQLQQFCASNNLRTPSETFAKENFSEQGTSLHGILEQMPVYVPDFSIGTKYNYAVLVDELAEQADLDLNKFDRSMLVKMARRRDEHIQNFLDHVPFTGKNASITIHKDDTRLYDAFYENSNGNEHERSGLPDILVTVKDNHTGKTWALILDYKTGPHTQDNSSENLQLAALTALAKINFPLLERVEASLITRQNIWQEPAVVVYDTKGIQKCIAVFDEVSDKATQLLDLLNDNSPALEDELFNNAKAGSACNFCEGKACCLKFHEYTKESIDVLDEIQERMDEKWAEISLKGEEDMTVDDLKEIMALGSIAQERMKLIKKTHDEAESMLSQYACEHGTNIQGVVETQGRKKFGFKPDMKLDVEEVAQLLMDAFPAKIRKKDVLAQAKITPAPIRKLIAKAGKIKEDDVPSLLDKMLGDENPFEAGRHPSKFGPEPTFIDEVRASLQQTKEVTAVRRTAKI